MGVSLCTGRGTASGKNEHCCFVGGVVCEFLVDNGTLGENRFRCGLMTELGDWDKVHADPRYAPLAIHWKGQPLCGDWEPQAGVCCRENR